MVLNDKGVACAKVFEWEEVGTKREAVGIQKVKRGRGYQDVVIYQDVPIRKKVLKLIPVTERGWRQHLVWKHPQILQDGSINIIEYTVDFRAFTCEHCRTNEHIYFRLMGWSYERYHDLPHHGSGVVRRCFGCDMTWGPFDPVPLRGAKGKSKVVEKAVTKERAAEVLRKTGLDFDWSNL